MALMAPVRRDAEGFEQRIGPQDLALHPRHRPLRLLSPGRRRPLRLKRRSEAPLEGAVFFETVPLLSH